MISFGFFVVLLVYVVNGGLCGRSVDYLGPKNPDEKDIERPCGAVYDINCVRQFFSEHAQCKETYGPAPDPIIRTESNLYLPRVNVSITFINQITGGINGRIDEFYINRNTDKLVIAIEFQNISMASDKVYFRFHRRAREPIVAVTSTTVTFSSVLITAVIPKLNDLQLDKAEYVAFVNDNSPPFTVASSVSASADPLVNAAYAEILENVSNNLHELFLVDSAYYPATFIQYNICDFGLKIV